jgi:hypothetical protein
LISEIKEIWSDIPGFEGLYQISNLGSCKSLERQVYHSRNKSKSLIKGKLLSTRINNWGYVSVRLNKEGKTFTRLVHRLMAEVYIPNPANKKYINHINADKTDNSLLNLEWVTHKENVIAAYKLGLNSKSIKVADSKGIFYYSLSDAANRLGIKYSICRNLLLRNEFVRLENAW